VGLIILMGQRTHEEDVVGVQLKENPELYDCIIIPAEDKAPVIPAYLKQLYVNGCFDVNRFPKDVLEVLERRMSDYVGQYLQTPKKPGGNIWKEKWFFTFTLDELYRLARAEGVSLTWNFVIDSAFTKKKHNDPTVCIAYCIFRNKAWIKDIFREWCSYTELVELIQEFVIRNGYSPDSIIWVEPKASGMDLQDGLVVYAGLNAVDSYPPPTDKISMANSVTPELKAGRVGILESAPWGSTYIEEVTTFPNATHDDQVDCTVMIIKNDLENSGILASG
jgi:predicted phage terminase large subunit-like protein